MKLEVIYARNGANACESSEINFWFTWRSPITRRNVYILTYVRVALATSDAQSILEIPATEKQNNNAEHIAIIIIYRDVNLNEATSAGIMQTYKKLLTFFIAQSNGSTLL